MKAVVLTMAFFSVFFNKTFCQKITHKDLIGTWDKKGPGNEKLSFKFTTSSNVVVESITNGNADLTYKLITDSIKGQTILLLGSKKEGIISSSYYSVHSINADTLKLMNLDYNDAIVQLPGRVKTGTFYLVRRN